MLENTLTANLKSCGWAKSEYFRTTVEIPGLWFIWDFIGLIGAISEMRYFDYKLDIMFGWVRFEVLKTWIELSSSLEQKHSKLE